MKNKALLTALMYEAQRFSGQQKVFKKVKSNKYPHGSEQHKALIAKQEAKRYRRAACSAWQYKNDKLRSARLERGGHS